VLDVPPWLACSLCVCVCVWCWGWNLEPHPS
jgi:hypothetical protein